MYKIDFDTKVSNIIIVIFQMKVIFHQNIFFQQTYVRLNEKFVEMFFVKSHELKFSIVIEMVQSIHMQYITEYLIKFCNYLNHFLEYICTL
jgi:hypothetical protein